MSLLTPERVAVKTYKWNDAGAPSLDNTANCMAKIFKACLDTGYGAKAGAGWTTAFEDLTTGIKVFRPEIGPHTDFYLRLSGDSGKKILPQIYLNMTGASVGNLKMQCTYPFKYATQNNTGRWLMIASARSVWFFCEQRYNNDENKTGSYFFAGDTTKNSIGQRAVYLQHSGGASDIYADYSTIFGYHQTAISKSDSYYNYGKILIKNIANAITIDLTSAANGVDILTDHNHIAKPYMIVNKNLYFLPAIYSPLDGVTGVNFDQKTVATENGIEDVLVFGTGGIINSNTYIAINEWWY